MYTEKQPLSPVIISKITSRFHIYHLHPETGMRFASKTAAIDYIIRENIARGYNLPESYYSELTPYPTTKPPLSPVITFKWTSGKTFYLHHETGAKFASREVAINYVARENIARGYNFPESYYSGSKPVSSMINPSPSVDGDSDAASSSKPKKRWRF